MNQNFRGPNPFDKATNEMRAQHTKTLLDEIDAWLCEGAPEHFDSDFFESLHKQFSENSYLSDRQLMALVNIAEKWIHQDKRGYNEFPY